MNPEVLSVMQTVLVGMCMLTIAYGIVAGDFSAALKGILGLAGVFLAPAFAAGLVDEPAPPSLSPSDVFAYGTEAAKNIPSLSSFGDVVWSWFAGWPAIDFTFMAVFVVTFALLLSWALGGWTWPGWFEMRVRFFMLLFRFAAWKTGRVHRG